MSSSTECWTGAALTSLWISKCSQFYAEKMGRLSLASGRYFRLLLIGYFEGLDSEGEIAWRAADSLGLRGFWEWD